MLASELLAPRGATSLGPAQRSAALAALRRAGPRTPLDVLVVGGGVVGCGAALDAAARGLSVGLVEAGDLAIGTSSRSSRLAHGGLRYLEQRQFALVHEALIERGLLLGHLAPHLVRPLPFLFPLTGRVVERSYLAAGVALYDLLSRVDANGGYLPRPRTLSMAAVRGLAPGLAPDGLTGALRYHDAQIDDARHTVAVARTAAGLGAAVLTTAAVTGLLHARPDAVTATRVVGARVRDAESGEVLEVHARVVLSAAGVWTDELVGMATGMPSHDVRRSRGVHLVVPRSAFRSATAVITRTPHSVLFLLPWGLHWLVGTTDTDDQGPLDRPAVTAADVEYLLGQANRWLARPLGTDDVVGAYAGLRPLLTGTDPGTTTLSREHAVLHPTPGFVAVVGGKYTTYRVMAADAVDAVAHQLPGPVPPSRTDQLPLVGASGFRALWGERVHRARRADLPVAVVETLLRRHGDRLDDVLDLVAADRALAAPLHPESPVLRAEAVVAARDEGARSVADILVRRTRIAVQSRDGGRAAALNTARLVAPVLGWDAARIAREAADLASAQPGVPGTDLPRPRAGGATSRTTRPAGAPA